MPGPGGRTARRTGRRRQTQSRQSGPRPAGALASGARTVTAVATLACAHRDSWTHTGGEAQCGRCGVRRFTEYRAVRPPGIAQALTSPRTTAALADRAAAEWLMRRTRRKGWRPGG
ncbi:DUF6255 family natural product biosynthesis protein [Streptomyces sp. NPDC051162]|uniref:DUF6255 family natural product biosynthesis protein n=1 Tax=unclassified Streptomyces TaxID=2593676 RepID=UPI00342570F9